MELLIIDDDYELTANLKKRLLPAEVKIFHAFEYQTGSRLVTRQEFSTVVLNLMLPGIVSGFDFLEDLRTALPLPILAIGGDSVEDRIRAYHLGADLVFQKPFTPSELAAAVQALLRRYYHLNRATAIQSGGLVLHHKDISLCPHRRIVTVRGQPVDLSPKEFDVLYFLASNPGIVFSQETIYERVWKTEFPLWEPVCHRSYQFNSAKIEYGIRRRGLY